jgi:hypothetical protein
LESPLARYLVDYRLYSFISNPDEGRCVGAVLATKTVRFLTINANAPVSHRIAGPNTTPLERAEEPDKIEITLDQKDAGGGLPSLQKGTDCH